MAIQKHVLQGTFQKMRQPFSQTRQFARGIPTNLATFVIFFSQKYVLFPEVCSFSQIWCLFPEIFLLFPAKNKSQICFPFPRNSFPFPRYISFPQNMFLFPDVFSFSLTYVPCPRNMFPFSQNYSSFSQK